MTSGEGRGGGDQDHANASVWMLTDSLDQDRASIDTIIASEENVAFAVVDGRQTRLVLATSIGTSTRS